MQEQELFNSYEIKNWNFSPRIYKILAVSAVFNVLALLIFAQTNMLTTKGCDSPLVGKVCTVLDTLVVGGNALTASTEIGDNPYVKTELTEDDEIVWLPVADKISYPEGYFQLSNPELFVQQNQNDPMNFDPTNNGGGTGIYNNPVGTTPPITPTPSTKNPTLGNGSGLLAKKPVLPKTRSKVVNGDLPTGFDDPTTNPTTNPTPKSTPKATPTPEQPTVATTEPVKDVIINKKPLKDFAANTKVKFEKKEVDLTKNFRVDAVAVITKEGKLDVTEDKKTKQPRSRFVKTEGDEKMIDIAKQALEAVGDSGWLGYLRTQGIDKINFTIIQDDQQLLVVITSDQPTPEKANTVASGVNGLIQGALLADRNNWSKLDDDSKVLLSNAKAGTNGNQFVLNFALPKTVAQEMITRRLNEPVTTETPETKPNSVGQIIDKTQKTAK